MSARVLRLDQRPARPGPGPIGLAGVLLLLALSGMPETGHTQSETPDKNSTAPQSSSTSGWRSLRAVERQRLAPLEENWQELTAAQQAKWRSIAEGMATLSADEQLRVQDRMREWSGLSSSARAQARLNFQELRGLPKESRTSLWEAYQQLPASERDKLQSQSQTARNKAEHRGILEATLPKSNTLPPAPSPVPPKAVSPVVVQAKPGATTRVMSESGMRPLHHQAGLPKIVATAEFVDPLTLLPRRGPQAAEQWIHTPKP